MAAQDDSDQSDVTLCYVLVAIVGVVSVCVWLA